MPSRGWRPVVAPEMEFYLVARQQNPHEPLHPPLGRSGKPEAGRQSYSIDAVNDFDPFFMELSAVLRRAPAGRRDPDPRGRRRPDGNQLLARRPDGPGRPRVPVQAHGAGNRAAPRHLRHLHGQADGDEPGSAMHIHQSLVDADMGRNIFSHADGTASELFGTTSRGLQKYLPQVMPMLAPYVNSYRRLSRLTCRHRSMCAGAMTTAPAAFAYRSPTAAARRVENRVPGVDVNPYLAMAATLACGYLGMVRTPRARRRRTQPAPGTSEPRTAAPPRRRDRAHARLRRRWARCSARHSSRPSAP